MGSVEQQVRKMVSEQLSISESLVTPEATFVEDLGVDSLDHVELMMNMEQAFDIEVSDEDAKNIHTVQDILDLIRARRTLV